MLCNENGESLDHLLLQCDFANSCWRFVIGKLGWKLPFPATVKELFQSWPSFGKKSYFSCIWAVCPSIVIWKI